MTPELQTTTHYSFLRGASSPEELFATAAELGIPALGVVDRHSVAGLVRALAASEATGVRLVAGCRIDLADGPSLLLYPTDRAGYGRMCRLLSIGKERAGKGGCTLFWNDLADWQSGLIAILVTENADVHLSTQLTRLRRLFGDRAYCALTRRFRPNDHLQLDAITKAAAEADTPVVATSDILYHNANRRMLQDVVTCIRLKTTIDEAGFLKEKHADRFLKAPTETARLFACFPEALVNARRIVERCAFSLTDLTYTYPTEVLFEGQTAQDRLEQLTWEGAKQRYPAGLPDAVATQIRHELILIEKMGYAPYFLTVESIVRFARSQSILCQGRGSAANSAVCYALHVTSIDPVKQGLLFERFVSEERREPPDIDVDFEHERREEVIQWIYDTYGRERSALTAVVSRYRSRGAVREVGKVLGVPEDVTSSLSSLVWGWSREGVGEKEAAELNLNLDAPRLRLTLDLAKQLIDTPRHLSQHPGGFVLTLDRLDELVPIEPAAMEKRQVIEWDKDDIEKLGFMKVDVLGLGMLGCMRRAFDLLRNHKGEDRNLAQIPQDDEPTYEMIRKADTLGTFQIESRAQMSMLPRLKPTTFYDLVIQVAIVRPGPIQGDMVHPYLRRREGLELPTYPTQALERVLKKTLGVPLFQEQAMQVAMVAAGFSATEADQLRRAMATFKFTGGIDKFRDKLIAGMLDNGYERDFAERTFRQLEGFGSYGFPESHAASFALIAYASAWMKRHHPDVFCAALLNAQPMGFYAPAQIVRDARAHGVVVLPMDVSRSQWDTSLEPLRDGDNRSFAVRQGLRLTQGLVEAHGLAIVAARAESPFASVEDLWRRARIPASSLNLLADADAFGSLKLKRREAIWQIKRLRNEPLPLFAAADDRERQLRSEITEPPVALTPMTAGREVIEDYRSTSMTLRAHPVSFIRADLAAMGCATCAGLADIPNGQRTKVAGLVLVRQMPGSAKGVMFITLEDETDIANLIVWPKVLDQQRRAILSARMMVVEGEIQRASGVMHVIVRRIVDRSDLLGSIGGRDEAFPVPHGRGDEAKSGGGPDSRDANPMRAKPRDIYIPNLHIHHGEMRFSSRSFR